MSFDEYLNWLVENQDLFPTEVAADGDIDHHLVGPLVF